MFWLAFSVFFSHPQSWQPWSPSFLWSDPPAPFVPHGDHRLWNRNLLGLWRPVQFWGLGLFLQDYCSLRGPWSSRGLGRSGKVWSSSPLLQAWASPPPCWCTGCCKSGWHTLFPCLSRHHFDGRLSVCCIVRTYKPPYLPIFLWFLRVHPWPPTVHRSAKIFIFGEYRGKVKISKENLKNKCLQNYCIRDCNTYPQYHYCLNILTFFASHWA